MSLMMGRPLAHFVTDEGGSGRKDFNQHLDMLVSTCATYSPLCGVLSAKLKLQSAIITYWDLCVLSPRFW